MDSPLGDLIKSIKIEKVKEKDRSKIEKEREREIVYENKSKKLVPFFLIFLYIKLEQPT